MTIHLDDIREAVHRLGLSDSPLCVHSSLRSFGHVDGGARTVVDGLLAEGCTVLLPTFSWGYSVSPPLDMRPERNGTRYEINMMSDAGVDRILNPESRALDRVDMGAISAAVLTTDGRVRGNHPLNSFTAVGPLAHRLIDGQMPLDVYWPLELLAKLEGWIVLMGVDLTSMTAIHLAEKMAGRKLFRRWANGPDRCVMMVETGGCSSGFGSTEPILAPIERRMIVGRSLWWSFPAKATVERAAQAIQQEPGITHCGQTECARCSDAAQGGPILDEEE